MVVVSAELLSVEPVSEQVVSVQLGGDKGRANCQLHSSQSTSEWTNQIGQEVKVKGLFVGFDDLLGEIQLKEAHNFIMTKAAFIWLCVFFGFTHGICL